MVGNIMLSAENSGDVGEQDSMYYSWSGSLRFLVQKNILYPDIAVDCDEIKQGRYAQVEAKCDVLYRYQDDTYRAVPDSL